MHATVLDNLDWKDKMDDDDILCETMKCWNQKNKKIKKKYVDKNLKH